MNLIHNDFQTYFSKGFPRPVETLKDNSTKMCSKLAILRALNTLMAEITGLVVPLSVSCYAPALLHATLLGFSEVFLSSHGGQN